MNPKVSVVLPVFNGERYLRKCIASVLQQTLLEFELLIGDNSSSDLSRGIVRSFSDSRIRCFYRDRNIGLFANLNQLIRDARGSLVHILCHDDLLEPNCLAEEVQFAAEHPGIGMFFCKPVGIDENGKIMEERVLGVGPEAIPAALCLQYFFYHGCLPGSLSTVCVRRKCFDEVGLFNESYTIAADYDMWVRICRQTDLGLLRKQLVRLRSHKNQLSHDSGSGVQTILETRKIRSTLLPMLPEEIRPWARLYVRLRQNVLDTHYSIRCVLQGRVGDFLKIIRIMGVGDFSFGVLCWLGTGNNHFYRPRPRFSGVVNG